jgi:hypothetical protein
MNDCHQQHFECHELLGSLVDYFEGTLDEAVCQEIESHMCECENCRIVIDTMEKTIEIYQAEGKQDVDLPETVRERLFYRLDLQDYIKTGEESKG